MNKIKPVKRLGYILLAIIMFLTVSLFGCQAPEATNNEKPTGQTKNLQAQAPQPQEGNALSSLFTYDDANAMQLEVKAALPQGEEAYEYPWGAYDDPIELPAGSAYDFGGAEDAIDADEKEKQLQEALNKLPPEKRKAAEEAMRKAQEQAQANALPQENQELPQDWQNESNQPDLGGRMEFSSGDTKVIIDMSEYCVDADTTFIVTPIKESKLPQEFLKGGFSLIGKGKSHITLNDYAVISFITESDPGDDVVIKSFGENGDMEYAFAEVMKLGNTYMITGAVEHFSTVGYGVASLPALAPGISKESVENLRKFAEEQIEQLRQKNAQDRAGRKVVNTIEFDEILYTKSAAGHPLQLHLRAKLVQQELPSINTQTGLMERPFRGKIWVKFYTWMPGGYGVMYMLCNNAEISDPAINWVASLTDPGMSRNSAAIQMVTTGGSQSVGEGVGSFNISGKSYSSVQTDWVFDTATGNIKVTFTNMKGAVDKTFITGKLLAKTERQANKKLKWFLD